MDEEKKEIEITKEDLFFNKGLYEKINIKNLANDIFSGDVEGFSPKNKIDTTFEISYLDYEIYGDNIIIPGYTPLRPFEGIKEIILNCKRKDESLYFYIMVDNSEGIIQKVGQYPSIEDISSSKIENRYSKILGKEWSNYKKSCGLFSHGIGIGSYVYIRRIFEELVYETFSLNKSKFEINDKDFHRLNMSEKIDVLKKYLPEFLVKNKAIYSIVSKGIHELSENECLKYFPFLRNSIEIILDQKIEILEKEQKEKELTETLGKISFEIK